jgi:AcrR family transcriptional regulator
MQRNIDPRWLEAPAGVHAGPTANDDRARQTAREVIDFRVMPGRTPKKHGYHHGDLGNAALAEVLVVLAERGPRGVTFAEVARRLGVTSAALYRHYADPQALLGAAAVESYTLFQSALVATRARQPYERLRAMVNAYLAFALEHPERYELMFGMHFDEEDPARASAGEATFAVLLETLEQCRPDAKPAVIHALGKQVWAVCHGFATLACGDAHAVTPRQAKTLLWDAVKLIVERTGEG